jgi:hypothetical protein
MPHFLSNAARPRFATKPGPKPPPKPVTPPNVVATVGQHITIVNIDARVTLTDTNRVAAAINTQLSRDVFPNWWQSASVGVANPGTRVAGPVVYLVHSVDVDGVLGYHDQTNAGVPMAVVSPEVSAALGEEWSVTLSHEVIEMVGDPHADLYAIGKHPTANRDVFYWHELCDACQDDQYEIAGVKVSNFLLPLYFTRDQEAGARNDFLGLGVRSLGIRPGGYVGFYDPQTGQEYNVFADQRARDRQEVKSRMGVARRSANRFQTPVEFVPG